MSSRSVPWAVWVAWVRRKTDRVRSDDDMREAGLAVLSLGVAQATVLIVALVRVPVLTKYMGLDDFGYLSAISAGLPLLFLPSLATRSAIREGIGLENDAPGSGGANVSYSARSLLTRQIAWIVLVAAGVGVVVRDRGSAAILAVVVAAAVTAATVGPSRSWGVLEGRGRAHVSNFQTAGWTLFAGVGAVVAAFLDMPLWVIAALTTLGWCGMAFTAAVSVGWRTGRDLDVSRERYARYWARGIQEFSSRNLMVLVAAATVGPASAGAVFVLTRLSNIALVIPVALAPFLSRRASVSGTSAETQRVVKVGVLVTCGFGAVIAAVSPWALAVLLTGSVPLENAVAVYLLTGLNTAIVGVEFLMAYARPSELVRFGTALSLWIAGANLALSLIVGSYVGLVGILAVSCATSIGSLFYYLRAGGDTR